MISTTVSGDPSYRKKTTKGRKKIEIKKIVENNSRQVTFSKRRTGLFKKAAELCVLTGAKIAILVRSPGGRFYTFGHPNADVIVGRYLSDTYYDDDNDCKDNVGVRNGKQTPPSEEDETESIEKYIKRFNKHYMAVSEELDKEKKRKNIPSNSRLAWYDEPVHDLSLNELERYLWSLEKLKKKVVTRVDELMLIQRSPALLGPKMFQVGWNNNNNNNIQRMNNNGMFQGGFMFQHGGNGNGNGNGAFGHNLFFMSIFRASVSVLNIFIW
ncbi:agamous-like MADS-box protein AGL29 [Rutidosis leptorrhynchoides]|uniref:agamous-like MADS-box protein AGL29 n=1 Tax=Rutidosis leptorrhynchoides TaxID=125765 RepID=UPI003A995589